LEVVMISSTSLATGLKEFGDGDAALFSGNMLMEHLDSQEDFDSEFRRLLTEEINTSDQYVETKHTFNSELVSPVSHNVSLSSSYSIGDFYTSPPDEVKVGDDLLRFEEDPLSSHLNATELQKTHSGEKKKRRGRPTVLKFKASEYKTKPPANQFNRFHQRNNCTTKPAGSATIHLRDRRSEHDRYTPVWIRGRGVEREGLCPLCEPQVWFKIKQSAYWYHMNFFHGISAATGRPYKLPISYRLSPSSRNGFRNVEGHCGSCLHWILIASDWSDGGSTNDATMDIESSIPMQSWYKHAQKCHHRVREIQIPDELDMN
jgi:hypothetical protein